MAFNYSFFVVLVLLASSVVLGQDEAGEATETTNAVKTASRKMLPIGGQIIKMLGVGVHDGQEGKCSPAGKPGRYNPWGCCGVCVCVVADVTDEGSCLGIC
ncbi:uncharacterized protein LOC113779240 [Coffea eugenioides]|uniref:uncharacterized protein LOC113779240 n=1 Tax=Coffea eugenioides TaxID=49369 RepID=UPI000F60AB54|nr:uncharacterized protein LOC113761542 isoform X2 [Coffea eugenioides]XP_027180575.1 uncharacterized protein LOC113779240 [Coffea eugenioides]